MAIQGQSWGELEGGSEVGWLLWMQVVCCIDRQWGGGGGGGHLVNGS